MSRIYLNCGRKITGRGLKYCNNVCQKEYEYKSYIERWKQGLETGLRGEYQISDFIKRYLFETRGKKCELCGWDKVNPLTKNVPVEIHHIDGDYKNNSEENLQILCPNCHSLTNTYKNSNTNNGRKERNKYSSWQSRARLIPSVETLHEKPKPI